MCNDFLISVVIPCYNVSEYIDRCLDSIVNQTIGINKLEIICVNDASTDDTWEKLKLWEEKYPENIMVITYKENQRQGAARNIGMQYATAEFLTFIDSDDWIEKDMLEDMYQRMISNDYDMVACKYIRDNGEGIPDTKEQIDQEYIFEEKNGYSWGEATQTGVNGDYGGPVTKLFRREWLIDHGLWFPEGLSYEDNYWIGMVILYLRRIYIIDKIYYHYWVNSESTVTSKNSLRHLDRIVIEEMLISKYEELGILNIYHNEIFSIFITRYYINTMHILFTRFDKIPLGIYERLRAFSFEHYGDEIIQLTKVLPPNDKTQLLMSFLVSNECASYDDLINLRSSYLKF